MVLLSIIIPVYEDIDNLLNLLEQIPKRNYLEVIVSTTPDEFYAVKDTLKKDKINTKVIKAELGRAEQMNEAACYAKGTHLWFLHADTNITKINLINLIKKIEKLPNKFIMSFLIRFSSERKIFRTIEWFSYLRQKNLKMPYGDQGILVPKKMFMKMHGFRVDANFEDFDFSIRAKKEKIKNIVYEEELITSPRRFEKHGIIYTWFIMHLIVWCELLRLYKASRGLYRRIS